MPGAATLSPLWLIPFAAAGITTVLIYHPDLALASNFLLTAALLAVLTAPTRLGVLSWSAGIPIFYVAFFIVLPLVSRMLKSEEQFDDVSTSKALFVAAVGLLFFALGTNVMRLVSAPRGYEMLGLLRTNWAQSRGVVALLALVGAVSLVWSYAFGYFGLIATSGSEAGDASGAISVLGFLLTIAHVISWNAYFTQRRLLSIALATTFLLVTAGMVANSKGQMLAPFTLIALCFWGATGKFPYKLVVISLLLYILVAFPFVTASRLAMAATALGASRAELADVAIDYLLSGQWLQDSAESNALASLGERLLPYFTEVVRQAGERVPYFHGKTLVEGLEIMIPRAIYPDKPDLSIGNWTGQAFGEVHWQDDITNLSPTFIGEFYMNFGLTGVCVGMALTGVLAVLVDRYLIVQRNSWTMPIMVSFVGWQEAFIGHSILPFIKSAFVWLAILLVVKKFAQKRSRGPQLPPTATQIAS
jgi:hypothetical protein